MMKALKIILACLFGILAIFISFIVTGDSSKPSFTVVLNSNCIIGDNGLI
ncbi:hypothetical protein CPAST_c30420 [Clostridium pasteurianum DSM 525 = ATCC 6013]|uniref:Uncharacterized protein n=1 Tax=Clostridium pasteurianum DSM 525 = ATCC 6013 TaxID=1262449 RepID=A0A0H3J9Z5_CLOPA|nr:hypothetical protein [Clostridium pasteurianum]AJA49108.1 hypothetical protein CPAST_c30420 [Clostridium pasteurianum DSM 525 = ATCC 6013]AJA53096.1 hypothetical protein CLPA_c30420 [Clostridium pasteurianum DSM 525 = ATCC 6013]KRU10896.1 hypothetical protein CP6013_00143 [Clostridium pasteurianum DSM 525 = ATCC 6013]UZW13417.1 hypothetical protein OSC52_16435 [Clostridium pasteurianum]